MGTLIGRPVKRLCAPVISLGNNVHISKQCPLTLQQVDQARSDFAAIEPISNYRQPARACADAQ